MLGYEDEELENRLGLAQSLAVPEDWQRLNDFFVDPANRQVTRAEHLLRINHKNGSVVDIHASTFIVRDKEGAVRRFVGTHTDVTERNRIVSELEESKLEAERANRAKSEFLASMSHELRTPLNAILGFSQLLELDTALAGSHRESVNEIHAAGKHLLALINEVLDLARVEAGRIDLSLEPVDCHEVVQVSVDLIAPLAAQRGITVDTDVPAGLAVRADRIRLKQVLVNLLSNAVKYNQPQGQVLLGHTVVGDQLELWVRDTGPGIDQNALSQLFIPFNRLGREAGDVQGSGIGLAFSKRLIELMRGQIGVESQGGQGSRFWVRLPVATLEASSEPAPSPTSLTSGTEGKATVLAIEDNPSSLRLVEQILAMRPGITLISATTGQQGLEMARQRLPHLILLDLNLPDIDGFEVVRRLKNSTWGRDLTVVALTASAMVHELRKAQPEGFSAYLTKPLDVSLLLETVDTLLKAKEVLPHA